MNQSKNIFKNLFSVSFSPKLKHYCSNLKPSLPLINHLTNQKVQWNFNLIHSQNCQIDCLLILNNDNFNQYFMQKVIPLTKNILIADGGANILYQKIFLNGSKNLHFIPKIKAIIGDLDSVTEQVRNFYQSKGVNLIKQFDQQKNDFQKTLIHGFQFGCKTFIVSGAFGNRLDHQLSIMSITQKYVKSLKDMDIILTSRQSIYCPLRCGIGHRIKVSQQFQTSGCGLVTFDKISGIETGGLKWNLGQQYQRNSIEWGNFLSTSNQIVDKDISIHFKEPKNSVAYFIARLKSNSL